MRASGSGCLRRCIHAEWLHHIRTSAGTHGKEAIRVSEHWRAHFGFKPIDERLKISAKVEYFAHGFARESLADRMLNQRLQRKVVAVIVEHGDGLGMIANLSSNQRFEELLEGTHAARKDEKRITALNQEFLALAHGLDHHEFVAAIPTLFECEEFLRDDSLDPAASRFRSASRFSHEPQRSATVDERDSTSSEQLACGACCKGEVSVKTSRT